MKIKAALVLTNRVISSDHWHQRIAAVTVMLAALLVSPYPVVAAASGWIDSDFSQIRLIAVRDNAGMKAGLHIRLEPGWKTYWRSPGDSGVPTIVDWSGSTNMDVKGLQWPVPKRALVSGFQSFVYQNEIVLPVEAKIVSVGGKTRLVADVTYAVCREICVPLQANLSLDLTSIGARAGDKVHRRLLQKFHGQVPAMVADPDFDIASLKLLQQDGKETLMVAVRSKTPLKKPEMFIEAAQPFSFSVPTLNLSASGLEAEFSFTVSGGVKKSTLAGNNIIVTAADGTRAFEVAHKIRKN